MAEKTFTAAEVAEMLNLLAETIEKSAEIVKAMIGVLPAEMLATMGPAKLLDLASAEHAKQIRGLAAMVKEA